MKPSQLPSDKPNNKQTNIHTTLDYSSLWELSVPRIPQCSASFLGSVLEGSVVWLELTPIQRRLIEEPWLLATAKSKLKEIQEDSLTSHSNQLIINRYLSSRQVTSSNYLAQAEEVTATRRIKWALWPLSSSKFSPTPRRKKYCYEIL